MKNNDLQLTQADQLGALLAEIDVLTKKAETIKASMKEVGGVHEGVLFRSTVVESNRAQLTGRLCVPHKALAPMWWPPTPRPRLSTALRPHQNKGGGPSPHHMETPPPGWPFPTYKGNPLPKPPKTPFREEPSQPAPPAPF